MIKFIDKISNKLIKTISICFTIMYGWFLMNNLCNNSNDLIHYNMKQISILSIIILAGIIFISITRKKYIKINIDSKYKKYIYCFIMLIVLALQIILTKLIYSNPGFDAAVLIQSGRALATNPSEFAVDYFARFPNNVLLVYIFKYIYIIASYIGAIDYERLLVIVNICCVDLSILMSLAVVKKVTKNQSVLGTYFLFVSLLGFSPWIAVAYSDTLSMLFPITMLYLYIKSREFSNNISKYIVYAAIGVLAEIGFQIKPTAIIMVIAIIIGKILFELKHEKKFKDICAFILLVSMSFCGLKVIYNNTIANMQINGVVINENKGAEVPLTHFLMMGLNEQYIEDRGYLYGAWNGNDYNITLSRPTKEERIRANLIEVKRRIYDLGPINYVKFLSNKGNWMTSDGSFYYGGEGGIPQDYITNTSLAEKARGYYAFVGDNYHVLASAFQSVWTIVLFLVVVASIFTIKGDEEVFIIKLCIIGITLFLLLFECRSRYLINHLPVFMVIAGIGLNKTIEMIGNIKISLHQK